jgi:archaellum component FlaG (FlaF/FlaG flagellin family)
MRKFFVAAMIAAAALIGSASQSDAAFQLAIQEDGVNLGAGVGVAFVVASGPDFTPISVSGTFGDFTVTFFGSTSTNNATLSSLLSSTTSVTNNSGAAHTLRLIVTQTNFTLPTGPGLNVESGMGGTVNIGVLGPLGVFQAYADKNNNAFGMGDFTNGPQNDTQLGSTFDTGSANGLFIRNATPFSVTSVAKLTMSGGGNVNYSNHVNLTAVPAPAGVVMALTGLPVLSIGAWLRRRKVMSQNS